MINFPFKKEDNNVSLFIFLVSFFLLLIFFHGRFEGYEKETFLAAKDLFFGNNFTARSGILGILLQLPFVLLYNLSVKIGLETIGHFAGPLGVVFYTSLIPIIFYKLNLLLFKNRNIAVWQSLLLIAATMIFPYSNIGMEHLPTLFILISFYFFVKYYYQPHSRALLFSFLSLGAAMLVKLYSVLFGIPIGIWLLWRTLKHKTKIKELGWLAFMLTATLVVYLGSNLLIHGNLFSGQYNLSWEFQYNSLLVGIYGFLLSPGKGIVFYNPILLLSIAGFTKLFRKEQALFWILISTILLFLLFQAPFKFWTDDVWGPRKLSIVIPLIFLPIGYFWTDFKLKSFFIRSISSMLVLSSLFVQFIGNLYGNGKYLLFLRKINLDSLALMQFLPKLSQINIHWFFLKSYIYHLLNKPLPLFDYKIESWFRGLANLQDVVFLGGEKMAQKIFYTPDLWYLSKQIPYVLVTWEYKIMFLFLVITGLLISAYLLFTYVKQANISQKT